MQRAPCPALPRVLPCQHTVVSNSFLSLLVPFAPKPGYVASPGRTGTPWRRGQQKPSKPAAAAATPNEAYPGSLEKRPCHLLNWCLGFVNEEKTQL